MVRTIGTYLPKEQGKSLHSRSKKRTVKANFRAILVLRPKCTDFFFHSLNICTSSLSLEIQMISKIYSFSKKVQSLAQEQSINAPHMYTENEV